MIAFRTLPIFGPSEDLDLYPGSMSLRRAKNLAVPLFLCGPRVSSAKIEPEDGWLEGEVKGF